MAHADRLLRLMLLLQARGRVTTDEAAVVTDTARPSGKATPKTQ